MAKPVAAIYALTAVIRQSQETTIMGLEREVKEAVADLMRHHPESRIAFESGCQLFLLFITRISVEYTDFKVCKQKLLERGALYGTKSASAKKTIARLCLDFVRDDCIILVHGFSRAILAVLFHAAENHRRFSVVITECRPACEGLHAAQQLLARGIPCRIILDSAIGYNLGSVSFVMVGAEAVVENGGVVNRIGTYTLAITAKALQVPFYVAVESYKFNRMYPLHQRDLPDNCFPADALQYPKNAPTVPSQLDLSNPRWDYTPPQFITSLFTDLGILTPAAVSDELIKLYL